jgi:hypothetical protein
METASTSLIAMSHLASAISTTKRIVRGMAPLLWPIQTTIASLARPTTTPSRATIDLAWMKCQRQAILAMLG